MDEHADPDVLSAGPEREPRGRPAWLPGRPSWRQPSWWPSGRRAALAAGAVPVLLVVAAGWVVLERSGPPGPPPPAYSLTRTLPGSTSTDLDTPVTVAHVRLPGVPEDDRTARLAAGVYSPGVGASFWFGPDPDDLDAVLVSFTGELTGAGSAAFTSALGALGVSGARLERVRGTTVAVTARATAACLAYGPALVLDPEDGRVAGEAFGAFTQDTDGSRAVLSYTGPERSTAVLHDVGAALAHSCGTSAADVTYTRHVGPGR